MKRFSVEEYKRKLAEGKEVKVKTIDGCVVRIIAVDRVSVFPVVGLMKDTDGDEAICAWTVDGRYFQHGGSSSDLVFDVEEHEGWVKVYRDGDICYTSTCIYDTREEVLEDEGEGCVDVVKITWEE